MRKGSRNGVSGVEAANDSGIVMLCLTKREMQQSGALALALLQPHCSLVGHASQGRRLHVLDVLVQRAPGRRWDSLRAFSGGLHIGQLDAKPHQQNIEQNEDETQKDHTSMTRGSPAHSRGGAFHTTRRLANSSSLTATSSRLVSASTVMTSPSRICQGKTAASTFNPAAHDYPHCG